MKTTSHLKFKMKMHCRCYASVKQRIVHNKESKVRKGWLHLVKEGRTALNSFWPYYHKCEFSFQIAIL